MAGLKDIKKSHTSKHLADAKELLLKGEDTARLNFNVPTATMNKFKAKCYANGTTMKSVVLEFIEGYIQD
ncbi:hypothetical protein PQC53_31850 (plasmid) [Pseudomonas aeruginosa]|nr:hypothetical protein PQC53_31850 [Pseudomonas aeruginosa]